MAKVNLTLEELMASRKELKQREKLESERISITKEQLSKLASGDDIDELTKQFKDIQSPRKVGNKIGFNTLHEDLTKLKETLTKTATGTEPKPERTPLTTIIPPSPPKEPGPTANEERTQRLQKIGNVVQEKVSTERGGSLNLSQTKINTTVFDKFVAQSKQRDDLLKNASEEQMKIFQELEDTLVELRGAGSKDSEKLRNTLAELEGRLKETKDTDAKGKIGYEISTARKNADPNNLGNVFRALMGKDSLLKKGYEREGNNIRNTETGQFASKAEASRGRFASAAGMLGQFIGRKAEEGVEGQRSEKFQGFLDRNFRSSRAEKAAILGGQLQGLKGFTPRSSSERVKYPSISASTTAAGSAPSVAPPSSAQNITITAENVNVNGKEKRKMEVEPDEEQSSGGGILDNAKSLWNKGKGLFGRGAATAAGTGEAAAGTGATSAGGGLLSGVGGKLLGGGALALGGTALQYGGDKLKEHGYEQTGKAVGVAGTAAKYAGIGAMIGTVVPGVGNVVGGAVGGVIGAGKGVYDQYFAGDPNKETITQSVGSKEDIAAGKAAAQGVASKTGLNASSLSMQNDAAKSTKSTPIIMPPAPAPQSNTTHSTVLPRGNLRPQESALERYTHRGSHFI